MTPARAQAVIALPAIDKEVRLQALASLGETPEQKAVALSLAATENLFEPALTAESIGELFQELPNQAVLSISDRIDRWTALPAPELHALACTLKLRTGTPLSDLAARDATAAIAGVQALKPEHAPPGLAEPLFDLADAGKLDFPLALSEAVRLSTQSGVLFNRLATYIDAVREKTYVDWSAEHLRALAALSAMHEVPDEDWPAGYEGYRIERAEPEQLAHGKEIYEEKEEGCIRCHGQAGQGEGGFPPLAGSPWVLGSPYRAASIVKHGLEGELMHLINPEDGKLFGRRGVRMEPMNHLSNADIAAALTYARNSWGNFAAPVTAKHVAAARAANIRDAEDYMYQKPADLLAYYPFERDTVLRSEEAWPKIASMKIPKPGLWYMLATVTAGLGLLLAGTYVGGRLPDPSQGADTAAA